MATDGSTLGGRRTRLGALAAPPRRWILAAFVFALALLTVAAWLGYRQSVRAGESFVWVNHTQRVQQEVAELNVLAMQAEAAHRAFLVTGNPAFVDERDARLALTQAQLQSLRTLTADNPGQQGRVERFAQLLTDRDARMHRISTLAQAEGLDAARVAFNPEGVGSIQPMQAVLAEMARAEATLFEQRSAESGRESGALRWLLLLGPGIGVAVVMLGVYALLGQLQRSEQMRRELARANHDARQALDLVDATHDAVLIYDVETLRISYANRGAVEQVGLPREALIGSSALDLKFQYDEPRFRRLLEPLQAGTTDAIEFETMHRHADGREIPVEVSMRYAMVADEVPRLVTVSRDISARKLAEDERDRFFTLSLDMLCISSADGYFKRLSPAFSKTLGWSIEEMLARPFLDFIHPDDHAATLAEVERQVVAKKPVLQFENRFRHKDGSWRVLSWKSAPQPDGRMYATARDVTDRREAEQRIVRLNDELTARQTALQAANAELEAFSYSVSHDLRAPLRHVDGYARMLVEDVGEQLDAEPRRYLRAITDSARRMGQLIDDLLSLSRLGRKSLEPREVDMRALAEEALADLSPAPAVVTIGVLPTVRGDRVLLRQLWANLLSNALKYSAPRGAEARIDISGDTTGDWVSYAVRDNGVGFDMRYADKLFGVFQRLHSSEQFEGTGVGLAIVQRVLHRHGGRIHAKGVPDAGAEFTFELPQREIPA